MTEIAFYHLETVQLEHVLPKLLEKTLVAGKRAMVLLSTEKQVEYLNGFLWIYDAQSWLPHGSANDGSAENQPIWLSNIDENSNKAEFLFLIDGATSSLLTQYDRCFELFDGRDPNAVNAARERWKDYLAAGYGLTYWSQNKNGDWENQDPS